MKYLEACAHLDREPELDTWKLPKAPLTWQPRETPPPPEGWQEAAIGFIDRCHRELMSPRRELKRKYLNRRGIKDESIIKFKLGWNNETIFQKREEWGLESKINEKTGRESKVWIPAGIVIPYIIEESPMRIRIRQAAPKDPRDKYIIVSGSNTSYMRFANAGVAQLVETELDGILIDQEAGDLVRVMAVGNSSARPDTYTHEILKKSPKIILSLDNDDAGRKEIKWWDAQYSIVSVHLTPGCKDVGDLFKAGKNVREWVEQGIGEVAAVKKVDNKPIIDIDAPPAITPLDTAKSPNKPVSTVLLEPVTTQLPLTSTITIEEDIQLTLTSSITAVAPQDFDVRKFDQDCHGVMCVHTAWKKIVVAGHVMNWNICRKHTEAVDVWSMTSCPLGKWTGWEHKFMKDMRGSS